jgi:hypothetical protein
MCVSNVVCVAWTEYDAVDDEELQRLVEEEFLMRLEEEELLAIGKLILKWDCFLAVT